MHLKNNLNTLYQNIKHAESQFHREPGSVHLLAVSKTQSSSCIRELWQCGQKAFGENYLQEALPKIADLADLQNTHMHDCPIEWHFIGPIQNNKTRKIAEHFSWVHTVDNLKTAQRLNDQRPENLPPLNICIQVNIDQEAGKSGILVPDISRAVHDPVENSDSTEQRISTTESMALMIMPLIQAIHAMPRLKLRGLMIIPEVTSDFNQQRQTFRKLHALLSQINNQINGIVHSEELTEPDIFLDTLSMGMSDDYVVAIAEGATIIRVGTALFGKRA